MKLTNKQKSGIAGIIAVAVGSVTPLVVQTLNPVPDFVDPFFAGQPVTTNVYVVLTNRTYVVAYDKTTMNPAWVAYKLYRPKSFDAPSRPSSFRTDKRLPEIPVSDYYTDTGFDRGHMAPNYGIAVCYGKGGQKETFLMSNVIPQTPGLNRGPWRFLEESEIRKWASGAEAVWVITGPLYFQQSQSQALPCGIKIPDACWKVLVRRESTNTPPQAIGFIIPQRVLMGDSFTNFVTTVDAVEEATGIDFFAQLPDDLERIMEAERTLW